MKWSDAYATGIQYIDEQHKMIFQMAEDYRASVEVGQGEGVYGLFLDFLDRYIRGHFEFEERCMLEYRCPVAQQNKNAHAELVRVVAGFRQRFTTSGFQANDARTLVDTIDRWLADHICGVDLQLKHYVNSA